MGWFSRSFNRWSMGTRISLKWVLYYWSWILWVDNGNVASLNLVYRCYFGRWTGLHLHILVGGPLAVLKGCMTFMSPFLDIICRKLFFNLMFYMGLSLDLVVTCCLWVLSYQLPLMLFIFFLFFFVKLYTL